MKPLWLELLLTPMAAPETDGLKRQRRVWQVLCLSLGASIVLLRPLERALGRAAPFLVAGVLAATIVSTLLYLVRKHRADSAWLHRQDERT
ncbi:hypothetical protein M527_04840 [Sphingobium indicum IP26]|uniref:Uncharacterized protein n=1 Tax=Sphingobium indicum F2 TaxID=1450518 RepID=A0A8E1C4Q9_9SPHN|nr:hypothetical protein [Sphingobium indicum]EPR11045.1 hypothetical protein M527_02955 [Sphingobium indicum IP26]EPR11415.1 hypothetical protein M527_04840 [Sphingobium indicum IP26]KER38183.1 hypothetical protein AL00_02315 [Sphingobium indicum F2]